MPNTSPISSTSPAITALSALITQHDIDLPELLETLQPLLAPPAFVELALDWDMCPVHLRDLDGCRDAEFEEYDEDDDRPLRACRQYRADPD